ncbi:Crp/Fnr family transcriptional regulator [Streptomyces sp. TLI_146]|uniref:Crp/Fnr family transcriptional regulator n=1 Tax=Streptomyces sp. TLI_146 TaxID=1938858 RepID=UPI000C706464|nr:cyclic nucleotide-binding domain-containing protein [Streptomyces sp. TLI_146]PKV89665.1 Cyclic nucleotide-binding domain-containing protein [Streptomyces sp. TLI_146]
MTTKQADRMAVALPAKHRSRLMSTAHEVTFPAGTRLFEEGRTADRFWVVRTGTVTLDLHVPGRRPAAIENLAAGELVGWSWLFPPCLWHFGAEAATPVRAYEFDAPSVRLMCDSDPQLGAAVAQWVGRVLAHRLTQARMRLLDLYAPHGSGPPR